MFQEWNVSAAKEPAGWGKAAAGSHLGVRARGEARQRSQAAVSRGTGESPCCSAAPSSQGHEDANRLWCPSHAPCARWPQSCISAQPLAPCLSCVIPKPFVLTLWLDLQLPHRCAPAWECGLWLTLAVATGPAELLPKNWGAASLAGGCCPALILGPACLSLAKHPALSPPWLCHPHSGCSQRSHEPNPQTLGQERGNNSSCFPNV